MYVYAQPIGNQVNVIIIPFDAIVQLPLLSAQ